MSERSPSYACSQFPLDTIEDNVVEEFDDAGNTKVDYTTEPDLYGSVVSQHRDGDSSFFHYDAQGSVIASSDDDQQVASSRAYSAFGEIKESLGSSSATPQYGGQQGYRWDQATGDYSVRRRVYSPRRARFSSYDPLGPTSEAIGLYLYAGNSPTNATDPSGLSFGFDHSPSRCTTTVKEDIVAICEMKRGNRTRRIEMPCLSSSLSCCRGLLGYYGMTPWTIASSRLVLIRTTKTTCHGTVGGQSGSVGGQTGVGALVMSPKVSCGVATTPASGLALAGTSLIVLIPWTSTSTTVDTELVLEPEELTQSDIDDKRNRPRQCRCTLRHMPDPERIRHGCPDRVYGTGINLRTCQAAAKETAPAPCRAFYGHCGWIR
jgi:RHS repeat-associated protein